MDDQNIPPVLDALIDQSHNPPAVGRERWAVDLVEWIRPWQAKFPEVASAAMVRAVAATFTEATDRTIPGPGEVVTAMFRAGAAGDAGSVQRLADVGRDPDRLAAVAGAGEPQAGSHPTGMGGVTPPPPTPADAVRNVVSKAADPTPAVPDDILDELAADKTLAGSGLTRDVLAGMARTDPAAVWDLHRQVGASKAKKAKKAKPKPSLSERVARRIDRLRGKKEEDEELVRQGWKAPPKSKKEKLDPDDGDAGLTADPPAEGVPGFRGRNYQPRLTVDLLKAEAADTSTPAGPVGRGFDQNAFARILAETIGRVLGAELAGTRLGRAAFKTLNVLPRPVRAALGQTVRAAASSRIVRRAAKAVGLRPTALPRLARRGVGAAFVGGVRFARTPFGIGAAGIGGRAAGAGFGRTAGGVAAGAGVGAAAGTGAAGATAGAGSAAMAAAGGPAGIAVAGVVALGVAANEARKAVIDFGYDMESANRKLSNFSPSQDAVWSRLDAERTFRDAEKGEKTSGTAEVLAESLDRFEDTLAPLETAATNLMNLVGAVGIEVVTNFTAGLQLFVDVLKEVVPGLEDLLQEREVEIDNSFGGMMNQMAAQAEIDNKRREAMRGAVRGVHNRQ